jgi:hypothetical protein
MGAAHVILRRPPALHEITKSFDTFICRSTENTTSDVVKLGLPIIEKTVAFASCTRTCAANVMCVKRYTGGDGEGGEGGGVEVRGGRVSHAHFQR